MSNYYTFKPRDTYEIILKVDDNSIVSFLKDIENVDYQQYLEWVAEGNTPEPWQPDQPSDTIEGDS
jgi:hypothetical protein